MAHSKVSISQIFKERFGNKADKADKIHREVLPIMQDTYKRLGIDLLNDSDYSAKYPFGYPAERHQEQRRSPLEGFMHLIDNENAARVQIETRDLLMYGNSVTRTDMTADPYTQHMTYDDLRLTQKDMMSRRRTTEEKIWYKIKEDEKISEWIDEHSLQPRDMFNLMIELLNDQIKRENRENERETTLKKINKEINSMKG